MNKAKQSWGMWIMGLALLVTTAGAVWVVQLRPGEDQGPLPDGTRPPQQPTVDHSGEGAICRGFVDVDGKIIDLNPLQQKPIVDLPIVEGQQVKSGQVLLKVEDRQAKNNVELAEAGLKAARADLEEARKAPAHQAILVNMQLKTIDAMAAARLTAKSILERKEELVQSKLVDVKEADAARHDYEKATALWGAAVEQLSQIKLKTPGNEIAKAEALVTTREVEVKQAKLALEHCTLTAPIDGEIINLYVAKGEVFVPQPKAPAAIRLCPDVNRIVRVAIEQEYAPRINEGMNVVIEDDVSAPGTWHGKIRSIGDIYGPKKHLELLSFNDVRTIECIVDLDPGQPRLKIGQSVRVKFMPTTSH
jgi:multidrug resistance efflux pump